MYQFFRINLILGLFLTLSQGLMAQNCQTIQAQIISNPVANDSGIIQLCKNAPLNLMAKGIYPQNDTRYHQSDSTAVFNWSFGNNVFSGDRFSYTFTEGGTFRISLTIKDTMGCSGTVTRLVRVPIAPTFRVQPKVLLALEDSLILRAGINRSDSIFHLSVTERATVSFQNPTNREKLFIPDNQRDVYSKAITIANYEAGKTLQSIDSFFVQLNIEHSWARDLEIKIVCPSQKTAVLHKFAGQTGNEIRVGIPISNRYNPGSDGTTPATQNDPAFNPPGTGLDYIWTSSATRTWRSHTGVPVSLVSGNYASEDPLSNLIGCPLNGDWTLSIKDQWPGDNGWVFYWKLGLPGLVKDSFKTKIASYRWLNEVGVQRNFGDSILVKPTSLSDSLYRFEVKDNFGCAFRSAYELKLLPKNSGLLSGDIFKNFGFDCAINNFSINMKEKPIKIFNATDTFYTAPNRTGRYVIPLKEGAYKVTTDTLPLSSFCADSIISVNILRGQNAEVLFRFRPRQLTKNLYLTIAADRNLRPGSTANLYVIVNNRGTYLDTTDLSVTLDTALTLIQNSGGWNAFNRTMTWSNISLQPTEFKTFLIPINISRFVPINTPIVCPAAIKIKNGETDTLDNKAVFRTLIVGSYDPNDKIVTPQGNVPYGTKTFDYTIRFQNTGNDTAFQVVLKDTLPTELDPLSISTLGSSHPYQFRLEGKGIATWIFNPIALPDSMRNERESHGFIRFSIQSKGVLPAGTRFSNRAGIYFDYNDVVLTNYAPTTIVKTFAPKDTLTVQLCQGDSYKNVVYTANTLVADTLKGSNTDTLQMVKILVKPTFSTRIDTVLKKGQIYQGIIYTKDTIVVMKLKAVNGCDSTITINIKVLLTAVNDLPASFSTLRIFPNPTAAYLSVAFELNKAMPIEFSLYNLLGQRIRILQASTRFSEGQHLQNFDIRDLGTGCFMIEIKVGTQFYRQLFIKE